MLNTESLQLSITASLYPAITGIVISEEEHIFTGQHRLDIENTWIERLVFPGGGEALETCGKLNARAWCKNEMAYKYDLLEHCDKPECPICELDWRVRATRSAVDVIYGKLDAVHREIDGRLFPSSVIWSTPPELWDSSIDELWKAFGCMIRKALVEGAAAILHPFRFRGVTGEEVTWTEYRVKSLVRPSDYTLTREPHFHSVIIGRVEMSSDELYDRTGWVYKKMKTPRGDYRLEEGDVFGVIFYALSHSVVSLDKQRQVIHYYGYLKKARIASETVVHEEVLCPDCGCPLELHYFKDIHGDSPVFDYSEPWHRKITHRTYTFEKAKKES